MKKNKKGFLLAEETLKTVIAVIVIMFLIYFLVSLYFGNLKEAKLGQAKATIGDIQNNSIALKEGAFQELYKLTPEGWYIFAFTGSIKPNFCSGKNCICICDGLTIELLNVEERQANECAKNGVCTVIDNLVQFEKIELGDIEDFPTDIIIQKLNNQIIIKKK